MQVHKTFLAGVILLSIASCGDSVNKVVAVTYRMAPNTALYGEADYAGQLLEVKSNMTAESCENICSANVECTFFYFNARGNLVLVPLTTDLYDCAFFRGELWAGSANNTDTYIKMIDGVDAWDL